MSKHLFRPGPWRVERFMNEARMSDYKVMSGTDFIATVFGGNQAAGNAKLIACAPEMLEAMQRYCNEIESGIADWSPFQVFQSLIQKATT